MLYIKLIYLRAMLRKHKVIIIPGLGDHRIKPLELAIAHWRLQGLEPIIHAVHWNDEENSFEPKLQRLVEMIDRFSQDGDIVSLVALVPAAVPHLMPLSKEKMLFIK